MRALIFVLFGLVTEIKANDNLLTNVSSIEAMGRYSQKVSGNLPIIEESPAVHAAKQHATTKATSIDRKNLSESLHQNDTTQTNRSPVLPRPQLVIIMDDMINATQLKQTQALGLTLNYAFIPPSKNSPHSAKLAATLDEYLVHLPLQARDFSRPEAVTLQVNDSAERIAQYIADIRRDFPKAKYLNNHTGSRFTADTNAMKKLMKALKQQRFHFIDSMTIGNSKGTQLQPQFGMLPLRRDVFFDNSSNEADIVAQMQKAVSKAKQQGLAIAIAHPRPATLATMKKHRSLFDGVDLIRVSQLPKARQLAQRYRALRRQHVASAMTP